MGRPREDIAPAVDSVTRDEAVAWMARTGRGPSACAAHYAPDDLPPPARERWLNRCKSWSRWGRATGRLGEPTEPDDADVQPAAVAAAKAALLVLPGVTEPVPDLAGLDPVAFAEWLLVRLAHELQQASNTRSTNSIAPIVNQIRAVRVELDQLRAAEGRTKEVDLSTLPEHEREAVVRAKVRDWPDQFLEIATEELIRRAAGRLRLVVDAEGE